MHGILLRRASCRITRDLYVYTSLDTIAEKHLPVCQPFSRVNDVSRMLTESDMQITPECG